MKALVFEHNIARFAAARAAGTIGGGLGARVGPLRLRDIDQPEPPADGWVRVRPLLSGICGSDLATIDGTSSRWFEPIVSFPFVPGHEIVGELDDGERVVVEPVLGCASRGVQPLCDACARGELGNCERLAFGDLEPGLQTGFCADTGGGWAVAMMAHVSQLHHVPTDVPDEAAVMIEPAACAIHGALRAGDLDGATVTVLGAGALGLLVVASLRRFTSPKRLIVAAKHDAQRSLARVLGADHVVAPSEIARAVRRATGSLAYGDGASSRLSGGADVVIDCVGNAGSIETALDICRPRGEIVLLGMPGLVKVDLTGLWQREIALRGAYTYGTERAPDRPPTRTFDLAFELVQEAELGRLLSATYPLDSFDDAIAHAANAGPRGAVKIAFDLREEKERERL
jgi:threonine dehydrogenase-like Zn-dependent dehydrogenase